MDAKTRSLLGAVIASLRDEPEAWVFDGYKQYHHDNDTSVWCANSYYGVHLEVWGMIVLGDDVSVFGCLVPWRRRLLNAALAVAAAKRGDALSDVISDSGWLAQ